MKTAVYLIAVMSVLLLACSKDKAREDGDDSSPKTADKATPKSETSPPTKGEAKPVPAVGKRDPSTPPHGGVLMDLMQVSKQMLDVDPPVTVAKHLTDTLAKVKKTPKVTCKPARGSQWQCEVWPGEEFGYFYSAKFDSKDGWHMIEGSAEVSPDD